MTELTGLKFKMSVNVEGNCTNCYFFSLVSSPSIWVLGHGGLIVASLRAS